MVLFFKISEKGFCVPTVFLWLLFVYIEASIRLKEFKAHLDLKHLPFHLDLCRPFAAHCIGKSNRGVYFSFCTLKWEGIVLNFDRFRKKSFWFLICPSPEIIERQKIKCLVIWIWQGASLNAITQIFKFLFPSMKAWRFHDCKYKSQ